MFQKYIIDMKLTNIKYVVQYIKQKVLQLCSTKIICVVYRLLALSQFIIQIKDT